MRREKKEKMEQFNNRTEHNSNSKYVDGHFHRFDSTRFELDPRIIQGTLQRIWKHPPVPARVYAMASIASPLSWSSAEFFVHLPNGIRMPILGLGTSHGGGYNHDAVVYAIKECGYRLIDTARRYGCEHLIAQAIEESGIPRSELFLTTKMWPRDYGYETGLEAVKSSLAKLDTDYLDLYMLHWPLCPSWVSDSRACLDETWRAMERLYEQGVCRSIGVSNFSIEDLTALMERCTVVPHVNQCEFHPYQNPKELREFCRNNNIQFQGYCPLGSGQLVNEPPVVRIAESLQKTTAQVLIRWSIQHNVVTIPKSTKIQRVKENSQVFDFELAPEHMQVLDNFSVSLRAVDPGEIQGKIDDNKPDGYKLPIHLQYREVL